MRVLLVLKGKEARDCLRDSNIPFGEDIEGYRTVKRLVTGIALYTPCKSLICMIGLYTFWVDYISNLGCSLVRGA